MTLFQVYVSGVIKHLIIARRLPEDFQDNSVIVGEMDCHTIFRYLI